MGKAEQLQELIDTNLSLLKAAGHQIDFKQGMFKKPNLSGFEKVGYALLMIIDPTECKSKIPWPLMNNKAQSREFRTSFTQFIKMINSKYPDAQIPEINASSLLCPGGMNFLCFMFKLSTFAMKLELKKTMSPEEQEQLLPRPLPCVQPKDQSVQLKIVKGVCLKEESTLLQLNQYVAEGSSTLQKMNDSLSSITSKLKSVEEQLKLEVSTLDFDDKTKESLLNIEDSVAITAYNKKTDKKYEELESRSFKLRQLHDLAVQCCQRGKNSLQTHDLTLCLDGHTVGTIRFLNELAGGPVLNVEGDVKLLQILRAAHTIITRLTRPSDVPALVGPAQKLLARCSSVETSVYKLESVLHQLLEDNKQAIKTLQPQIYNNLKKANIPRSFRRLKERPPLNFGSPQSISKTNKAVKPGKKRKSLGSIIVRKREEDYSHSTRQEPKKHAPSTPVYKTRASRKSLSSVLQFGSRLKSIEEENSLDVTPGNPAPLSPVLSSNQGPVVSEPGPSTSCTTNDISPLTPVLSSNQGSVVSEPGPSTSWTTNEISSSQPSLTRRCIRKSLNDIIERYLKLKRNMNMSSDSKSETDTCNDS